MAHFRGTVEGQRGAASRLGSASSGLLVTAHGWQCGVRVYARSTAQGDVLEVYMNGGSGWNSHGVTYLGCVEETAQGPRWRAAQEQPTQEVAQ